MPGQMVITDRVLIYCFVACITCFIIVLIVVANLPQQKGDTYTYTDLGKRPAFFASLTSETIQLNLLSDIVKFDKVWTNIQHGYDSRLGVYTAPADGLYYFSSTIMTVGDKKLAVQLNRNNDMLVSGYATDKNGAAHTMTAIVTLNRGDKVYVKHRDNVIERMYGGDHTNFCGYMIQ